MYTLLMLLSIFQKHPDLFEFNWKAQVRFKYMTNLLWSCIFSLSLRRFAIEAQDRSMVVTHWLKCIKLHQWFSRHIFLSLSVQICKYMTWLRRAFICVTDLRIVKRWSEVWYMSETQTFNGKGTLSSLLSSLCWVFDWMCMGNHGMVLHSDKSLK